MVIDSPGSVVKGREELLVIDPSSISRGASLRAPGMAFSLERVFTRLMYGVYAVILGAAVLDRLTFESTSQFLLAQFSLTAEANFPTWLAATIWFSTSIALFACYYTDKHLDGRSHKLWLFLCAAFGYASIDEICRLHERMLMHFPQFSIRWQHIYVPVLLVVAGVSLAFLWRKLQAVPRGLRLLVVSILCFAVAIFLEPYAQEPAIHEFVNQVRFIQRWNIVEFTEEMLELFGAACALQAVLGYLGTRWRTSSGAGN